jgi:hypothetical protein
VLAAEGWAGLADSYFWTDPTKDVTGVFRAELFPFADAGTLVLFRDLERAVHRSI